MFPLGQNFSPALAAKSQAWLGGWLADFVDTYGGVYFVAVHEIGPIPGESHNPLQLHVSNEDMPV